MDVKPGYKQTEVGVIPAAWNVKSFCEIGALSKGKGLLKEDIKRVGAIPAIPYTALYTDYSEIVDYGLIKWFIDDESQSVIMSEPCLLLASSSNMEANTGKASALVGTIPVAIGREIIVFKTSSDCKFVSYLLSTTSYRKKTLALARGTTIKHLYPATFKDYQIAVPPIEEQRAIAGALSDVDELIAGLERLIAKKRDIKQATMQQLLTGQIRLPGFSGKWRALTLSEATAAPIQNGLFFEPARKGSGIPLINVIDLYSELPIANNRLERFRATRSEIARFKVAPGDLFFTRSSITADGIAFCNVFFQADDAPVVFDSHIIRARPDRSKVDSLFLAAYCRSYKARKYLVANAKSTTMTTIDQRVLGNLPIDLPPIDEQIAISTILDHMDCELAALEAQRDKTRLLKQGMMQELLTGKTRLV